MDWKQFSTILWLRWRLTANQWSRGGQLNAVIGIIVGTACVAVGLAGGFAGLLAGFFAMADASPMVMLTVWDTIIGAFLFFWMVGIVSEIQRSETIDIGRLLHLPVSVRDIFLFNYLASHLSLSIILFLPGMLGLSAGLALGRSWYMICLLPLVLGFIFMITAWTYCLRGWLVRLMVNKRRRRAVIAAITLIFIILCQLPNIFVNVMHDRKWNRPNAVEQPPSNPQTISPHHNNSLVVTHTLLAAHKVVPFLWLSNGAMSLATGKVRPAILAIAGSFLIGGLGLRRAYRATVRFYQGQEINKSFSRQSEKVKTAAATRNSIEIRLPGISEEASALAIVFFRCLTRAPEIKMALATNIFMLAIFGGMFILQRPTNVSEHFKPFIVTGTVAITFFGMLQFFFNQFGYDRDGFRTLVLSPVRRKDILLGKNLALMPIAFGIGGIFLTLVKFAAGVSLATILTASLQLAAAFLLLAMAGNLASVLFPYRIAPGSLKPTKTSLTMTVVIFLTHLLFPVLIFLIFLPPLLGLLLSGLGWLPAASVNFLLSLAVLVSLVFCYRLSLKGLGDLLQHREKIILQVVAQEVE